MGRLVRRSISLRGLYQGFDSLVWCVVALQVFGGLIVGMVVKYADNIQKNFANALSVIFTVLGAIPLFGQVPSAWFVLGVACTMTSVFMYQKTMPSVCPRFNQNSAAACEVRDVSFGIRSPRLMKFLFFFPFLSVPCFA